MPKAWAAAAGARIPRQPLLLGPIFAQQGWNDSPFNIYPARDRYMWRDVERLCAKYRLPFAEPSRFPRNSLLAEDCKIGEDAEIRLILSSLEEPQGLLIERARTPEIKASLREQTRRAGEFGIFGAPSFTGRRRASLGKRPSRGRPGVGELRGG